MELNYEGSKVNLKKIYQSFKKYKWTNLSIILLFLLFGLLYLMFAKPIYKTSAKVQIETQQINNNRDFLGNIVEPRTTLETQMDILTSNRLIDSAIKNINAQVRFFKKAGAKEIELYRNSPYTIKNFIIYNPNILSKKIEIIDMHDGTFKLRYKKGVIDSVKKLIKDKSSIHPFNGRYQFSKIVLNDDIALKIDKNLQYSDDENSGGKIFFQIDSIDSLEEGIKQNLTVQKASKESSILDISYKDSINERARDIVNSLLKSYIDYTKKVESQDEIEELKFVNEQIDKIKKQLEKSENLLEDFKQNNNISDLNVQNEELVRNLGEIRNRLDIELIEYQKAKRIYEEISRGNYNIISGFANNYPTITDLVQRVHELTTRRDELLEEFTQNHPRVISLNRSIKRVKNSIKEIAKGILEEHLNAKNRYEKELLSYKEKLKKYPIIEKYLVRHKRIFDVNDNIYNYLLRKQSELNVQKLSTTKNTRVIDYAKLAPRPLNKKVPFILFASLLLGLFASLLYSILRNHFDTKIKSAEDIESVTDIPIYGIIPYIENKNEYNSLFVLSDPNSGASEAFRAIRSNLNYISDANSSKVILISSSVPNEGKTVVAANLSTIIGMSEKKVILLSLDLRKPELHNKFSLPNDIGMSDILSGKVDYKETIWEHSKYKNLHIITSGKIPPNPAELIDSKKMIELLSKLKKEYDYIIIDTAPLNYVSDATSLFKYSDLNLFVFKSEFSDVRYLKELDSLLKKLNIKKNGIILNSVKSQYTIKKYFDERYVAHKEKINQES